MLALGWRLTNYGAGWGALFAALTAAAFAEAARFEEAGSNLPPQPALFSRRNAILLGIPFALAGWWAPYLVVLATYAAVTLFILQHFRHRLVRD